MTQVKDKTNCFGNEKDSNYDCEDIKKNYNLSKDECINNLDEKENRTENLNKLEEEEEEENEAKRVKKNEENENDETTESTKSTESISVNEITGNKNLNEKNIKDSNTNITNECIYTLKKNIPLKLLKISDALKNIGNKYFKENNYLTSLKYYTDAIYFTKKLFEEDNDDFLNNTNINNVLNNIITIEEEEDIKLFKQYYENSIVTKKNEIICIKDVDIHMYYTNRAFSHMKLENYGLSIEDINEALKINPHYAKAYYRKGCSYLLLSNLKEAIECFQKVLKLCKDKTCEEKLKQCKKLLYEQEFNKAIELEQKMPYYQTINLESIKIEHIEAPIYDKNNLTIDFLKQVVEYISVPNQRLNRKCVCAIILDVIELYKNEKTLIYINLKDNETLTICGDIHGQFYDLLNILKLNGYPSENNSYLFNGDFVDRGSFSVEVIIFLYLAKLVFPNNIYLTRGNHETDSMNKIYGFLGELLEKYDDKIYTLFSDSFKLLPLAYVLNNKIFICHGGIPRNPNVTLKEIENIDRNMEPLDEGIMTDLLWSDPIEENGIKLSKRGIGFSFGIDITESFLKNNNLSYIIRSHEVRDNGYALEQKGLLYTVFSAPNYCDIMRNKGAYLKFTNASDKPEVVTFEEVSHPNIPPLKYACKLYQGI